MNDYSIYKKYNQVIIPLSCILISISSEINDNQEFSNKELESNREIIMNLFKEFHFINISLIEKCSEDILNVVKLNINEEKEEENEGENTRDNSNNSSMEISNQNNNEKMIEKNNVFI